VPDPLLDDLDAHQRAAVASPHVPLAVIAPAGSGKTRVLTRRIAFRIREGGADARHVLALTFTRKAAGELVDRLRRLGVDDALTAGTFHAVALAQLRRWAAAHHLEPPRVLDHKARLLAPLLGNRRAATALAAADVAAEIEWAKARLVAPDEYADAAAAARRNLPRPAEEIAEHYARYESEKRRRRLLDFDDVLRRCADLVGRDPEFAEGQRFAFRHLFVDEFQDATPLQIRLLRAWLGARPDLSVVGDPAQAIYGFAGADASPLLEFGRSFPGGRSIALVHNYRSTPDVVTLAEAALAGTPAGARRPPVAVRGAGAPATVVAYDDADDEAAGIAERCWRAFTAGVPWRDMAVLFRTNAQAAAFEAAFTRRNVPFRLADDQRAGRHPETKLLLDRLRTAERDAPGRPLADLLADLAADEGADEGADEDGRAGTPEARDAREALLERGRAFVASEGGAGGVSAFAAWLDLAARAPHARHGVELVTFHRAKGLEWPVVFVTGLEAGLVPSGWATGAPDIAEERRLLHVALSRARDEVHCSWAHARAVGGRRIRREPSPWLAELERIARHRDAPRRDARHHLADARATLAATQPPPPRTRRLRSSR
jgi:DNA helicase-2/ATP-dependent DNA helicase PcrA